MEVLKNVSEETCVKLQLLFTTIIMLGLDYSTRFVAKKDLPYLGVSIKISERQDFKLHFIFNSAGLMMKEDKAELWIHNTQAGFHPLTVKGYVTFDEIITQVVEDLSKILEV